MTALPKLPTQLIRHWVFCSLSGGRKTRFWSFLLFLPPATHGTVICKRSVAGGFATARQGKKAIPDFLAVRQVDFCREEQLQKTSNAPWSIASRRCAPQGDFEIRVSPFEAQANRPRRATNNNICYQLFARPRYLSGEVGRYSLTT